jgi:hypothetical protein
MIGSGIQVLLKLIPQQFKRLQCWHYWWEGFIKEVTEMILGAMIYESSFTKIVEHLILHISFSYILFFLR